jgi:hypothetical protein
MTKSKSLLSLFAIFISGCNDFPAHEFCVVKSQPVEFVHPATGNLQKSDIILGAWCSRTDSNEEPVWKPAEHLNKWISRHPRTEQSIIEWAKRSCNK